MYFYRLIFKNKKRLMEDSIFNKILANLMTV